MTINELNICSKLEEAQKLLVEASALLAVVSQDVRHTNQMELGHDLHGLNVRVAADAADVSRTLGRTEVIAKREYNLV